MSSHDLTHTLIESFNALADEVQNLIDRKTILEHKLRYAREQYQYLADKYAPAEKAVSETLAKLQLPPETSHPALANTSLVPLPRRGDRSDNAQIALFIREGRKVASKLSIMTDPSKGSFSSSKDAVSTGVTTLSAAMLEQDFTVEGKRGQLQCPFSASPSTVAKDNKTQGDGAPGLDRPDSSGNVQDPTPHASADPICAAMLEETTSQQPPPSAGATKCPIRFLDQHSTEEIAHYVETHKHEMPRSHEVCIQRYQRNEEQIRKLDAKYGSLVGMIGDLSQIHKPMLPIGEMQEEIDRASNERVENWAAEVSANEPDAPPEQFVVSLVKEGTTDRAHADDDDRESHFDRVLKEVRVGESPSRPWGISVPIMDDTTLQNLESERPVSPPPAPVHMPPGAPGTPPHPMAARAGAGKCPFDHTKLKGMSRGDMSGMMSSPCPPRTDRSHVRESGRRLSDSVTGAGFNPRDHHPRSSSSTIPPKKQEHPKTAQASRQQPTFINPSGPLPKAAHQAPQMVFTGPVFIGYPIEQAIQFMQHFQNGGQQ
ncbi:hypothetical protein MGG_04418 [Pyricularia oryzae 70-15]|uniref:Uncharacterized protein n=1 Tax=Pyricularia oryzae (strain 70-15 / ATCC MYA-4617 / FGSC 8958) TaxID=242507 RepID=G4MKL0_PYRO7|nr:uncharacterized protein MGG_04418 [Pyricularia oryzae 70-15]EHA58393.1 hypothetical protein MGG_04418 [Pyricularia oryzae 70-15]